MVQTINDPDERAKALRKLENEIRSANKEYKDLVKQAKKEAEANAEELGVSKDYVLKEFNGTLKGK